MVSREALHPPAVRDAVDLLLAQHARIEELFRLVLLSEGEARRAHFTELVQLLTVHEAAEEAVVHPLARDHIEEGADVVGARLTEERRAKELLAQLDEVGPEAPEFRRTLIALRNLVLMHAKKEERYEFRQLRHTTDLDTRRRLADAVRAAEMAAPSRPHPGTR